MPTGCTLSATSSEREPTLPPSSERDGSELLVVEEYPLAVESPAVPAEAAVRRDDAMARHDDRHRVAAARISHRARGTRLPHRLRDFLVAAGLATRDAHELAPHLQLERGAAYVERE